MGKQSGSGSGMNNPDHMCESLETIFGLKNFNSLMRIRDGKNSDPGSEMENIWIRDPGSGLNISDPQHCFLYMVRLKVWFLKNT
jgi:hypothetical protein